MRDAKGAWCSLLLFVCLAAVWIALRVYVRNPMFGQLVFDPSSNSLCYFDRPVSFNFPDRIRGTTRIDLDTGRLEAIQLKETTLLTHPLANGERLRFRTAQSGELIGFEIFSVKTGQTRIETAIKEPLNRPVIVGNRYLVGFDIGRGTNSNLTIVDMHAGDAVADLKRVPFQPLPPGQFILERKPLGGTPQFAVTTRSPKSGNPRAVQEDVVIFEINDGETRELSRWTSGCSPANLVDHNGKLYSLSADGTQVEIRELPSLQLVEKRPLRSELAGQWSKVRFIDGMGRFDNTATGQAEFFRLSDLAPIEVPRGFQFWSNSEHPARYVLSGHRAGGMVQYAVIDREDGKIVFTRSAGNNSSATLLNDDCLGIGDLTSCVSVELIELPTGNVIKRIQPYAWLDWCIPLLALASVANCVFWIHAAHAARLTAAVSILTLTTIVGGLSLFGCLYYGTAWHFERPCWGYLFAALACMLFVSGWYAALGRANWSRRLLALVVGVCVGLQVVAFLHSGNDSIPSFVPSLMLLSIIAPVLSIAAVLWIARLLGLTWYREEELDSSAENRPQRIALTDYF